MGPRILTIGHGLQPAEDLIGNLLLYSVELVVDVRSHPRSARAPHFDRDSLRSSLERVGLEYLWRGDSLGGRPPQRLKTPAGLPDYDRMLQEETTQQAISELASTAATRTIALLCSESRPEDCHRFRMLAPAFESEGLAVGHVLPTGDLHLQPSLFG
jgi:uncharacterized protein (DUF488 family)